MASKGPGVVELIAAAFTSEVVAKAMQMADGLDLEIWDHKRFVARLGAKAESW
jgi:hypothetical protein